MRLLIWITLALSLSAWSFFLGRGVERHKQQLRAAAYVKFSQQLMSERDACLSFLDEAPLEEKEVSIEEISI